MTKAALRRTTFNWGWLKGLEVQSIIVGPHFGPGLGLEDKPEPGSSFETCFSHFCVWMTCLVLPLLRYWPCQSLHIFVTLLCLLRQLIPPKNPSPYVPNLYKQEADAIELSFYFDKTPS